MCKDKENAKGAGERWAGADGVFDCCWGWAPDIEGGGTGKHG